MKKWTRKPEEQSGDYYFSGRSVMTVGVDLLISQEDIFYIDLVLTRAIKQNDGLDYLQVFECEDGRIVWAIDQLSKSMKRNGDYTPEQVEEYDYWTVLLPEEY